MMRREPSLRGLAAGRPAADHHPHTECAVRIEDGRAMLGVPEVFDHRAAEDLRTLLTVSHDGYDELVLDFSDVVLVKTCAVALLVALRRRCASRGVELVLTGLSPAASEFLVMTGLHRTISAEGPLAAAPLKDATARIRAA